MEKVEELKKQYEECERSGYFFFIPERSLWNYIENECSVANMTVEADGCLGQE